jgi:hypothetical protein
MLENFLLVTATFTLVLVYFLQRLLELLTNIHSIGLLKLILLISRFIKVLLLWMFGGLIYKLKIALDKGFGLRKLFMSDRGRLDIGHSWVSECRVIFGCVWFVFFWIVRVFTLIHIRLVFINSCKILLHDSLIESNLSEGGWILLWLDNRLVSLRNIEIGDEVVSLDYSLIGESSRVGVTSEGAGFIKYSLLRGSVWEFETVISRRAILDLWLERVVLVSVETLGLVKVVDWNACFCKAGWQVTSYSESHGLIEGVDRTRITWCGALQTYIFRIKF